jgi:hypothetical protein
MNIEFTLSRKEYEEFAELAAKRILRISGANTKIFTINVVAWIFLELDWPRLFIFIKPMKDLISII